MNIENLYKIFLNSSGVSIDSRTVTKGQMYFALNGENFNGNDFVDQAIADGAIHAVATSTEFINNSNVTVVEDVLISLQQLSTYHRTQLDIPVVALTGSNGKTTTKELILSILSQEYHVTGTKGNLNNHIGVPLTLLSFTKNTEIGIVEMGANHQKEIAALCKIAKPDFGLITNYGKAHLEGFGGEEGIVKGKSELYDYLIKHQKIAILGTWDKRHELHSKGTHQIFTPQNTLLINAQPFVSFQVNDLNIKTHLTGNYNYQNALLAYTVGTLFKINPEKIKAGIESYIPTNHRSQIIEMSFHTVIMDAYNANPSSMEVAIENLAIQNAAHKIAILGDMFELGEYAKVEHQQITDLCETSAIDTIYLIGKHFYETTTIKALKFESIQDFKEIIKLSDLEKSLILIKGSRGMALEELLNDL